jgi:hypothetical protein
VLVLCLDVLLRRRVEVSFYDYDFGCFSQSRRRGIVVRPRVV